MGGCQNYGPFLGSPCRYRFIILCGTGSLSKGSLYTTPHPKIRLADGLFGLYVGMGGGIRGGTSEAYSRSQKVGI